MQELESAQPLESEEVEHVPVLKTEEEKDGLERFGGRKWILAMYVETIASIFTAIGLLPIDQWLMVTAGIISLYFGVNFMQKKKMI